MIYKMNKISREFTSLQFKTLKLGKMKFNATFTKLTSYWRNNESLTLAKSRTNVFVQKYI